MYSVNWCCSCCVEVTHCSFRSTSSLSQLSKNNQRPPMKSRLSLKPLVSPTWSMNVRGSTSVGTIMMELPSVNRHSEVRSSSNKCCITCPMSAVWVFSRTAIPVTFEGGGPVSASAGKKTPEKNGYQPKPSCSVNTAKWEVLFTHMIGASPRASWI